MIYNTVTKETFSNRKEAKQVMGHAAFNKAVKNGELQYSVSVHGASDIII